MSATALCFEFYNNTLCVHGGWLINNVVTPPTYKALIRRNAMRLLRRGGNGRTALVEFDSMRPDLKEKVVAIAGDPKETVVKSILEKYIDRDYSAASFFANYVKATGRPLSLEKQLEYTTNACILNAIDVLVENAALTKRKVSNAKTRLWLNLSDAVNSLPSDKFNHTIPTNVRSLQRVYNEYRKDGVNNYASLVHGGEGNDNRRKIKGEVADWILATYCLPTKPTIAMVAEQYETIRSKYNWPPISPSAINLFLDQPENARIWTLARHGKDEYNKKFGHKLSRDRGQWFPNAYWAIDGTKLDWVHYYDNALGMAAKLKINPVFDVYSEMIIGYSISETETHVDHFTAIKMAVKSSGKRPYLLVYDNQSGHKSSRMQELYNGLVARNGGTHQSTRAYNKSNPAEQLFNRLQQEVISQFWFSDKQTIKARNLDNVPNVDFIKQNKHKLYSREELIRAWELAVQQWNEGVHPHLNCTRSEAYTHEAPFSEPIDHIESMNLFWVDETKPIRYKNDGITVKIGGQPYMFEVYDQDNKIDLDFRRFNIGKKFIVRYDPEELDTFVQLLEVTPTGDKLFSAVAQPKRKHQEIPVLMQPGQKAQWYEDFKIRDTELERDQQELRALLERTGITPEKVIEDQDLMIKMGGSLPKDLRSESESDSVFSRL